MPDDQCIEIMQCYDPYRFVTQRTKTNRMKYDNNLDCKPLEVSDAEDSITRQKTLHNSGDGRPRSHTSEQRFSTIHQLPLYTHNEIRSRKQSRPVVSGVDRREGLSCPPQRDDRQTCHDVNFQHNLYNRHPQENESRYASYPNNDGTAGNLAPPLLTSSNILNEAMYQPRSLSFPNSSIERGVPAPMHPAPHHERVGTAQSSISENILNQQIQLMQEMFRIMSTQNANMRNQLENRDVLKVKPEKFSGSGTSFHTFMAQFENCSIINKWSPQEKLLMLRSSLTGNALSVLWDIRMDRDGTYEDLVEMLHTRYGSKGQAETSRCSWRRSCWKRKKQKPKIRRRRKKRLEIYSLGEGRKDSYAAFLGNL